MMEESHRKMSTKKKQSFFSLFLQFKHELLTRVLYEDEFNIFFLFFIYSTGSKV